VADELQRADNAQQAQAIISWRYVGQHVPTGTRIDQRCTTCGHRVCLDASSSAAIAAATKEIICRECAEVRFGKDWFGAL
jgi:hypothetical protein